MEIDCKGLEKVYLKVETSYYTSFLNGSFRYGNWLGFIEIDQISSFDPLIALEHVSTFT